MKRYALVLLLALTALVLLPGCARLAAASPGEDGVIEIVMDDYSFSPNTIRLQAGQTVTIRLRNEGSKMHEFMAGRDIQLHGNFTEGFGEDFFAGIDLDISGPGMVMGLEGMEMDMGGMDMGTGGEMDMDDDHEDESTDMAEDGHDVDMDMAADDHAEGSMDMDDDHEDEAMDTVEDGHDEEMDMGADDHDEGTMDMDDDHEDEAMDMAEDGHDEDMDMGADDHDEGEEDHDEAADNHQEGADDHQEGADDHQEEEEEGIVAGRFGAVQLPSMDAHAGVMIMIDPQMIEPGQATTITFTVPESKIGTWEIGCFQERGQHYDDGMNGLIIVER